VLLLFPINPTPSIILVVKVIDGMDEGGIQAIDNEKYTSARMGWQGFFLIFTCFLCRFFRRNGQPGQAHYS
jgi:hypothetical protein